jgi:hypothetical protein
MQKLFWFVFVLAVLIGVPLLLPHFAFALPITAASPITAPPHPLTAPEIDPQLAVEGLALTGGVAVFLWGRIRRRR